MSDDVAYYAESFLRLRRKVSAFCIKHRKVSAFCTNHRNLFNNAESFLQTLIGLCVSGHLVGEAGYRPLHSTLLIHDVKPFSIYFSRPNTIDDP